jgi:predicted Rossmann fold nucleotide-binding protein DprA/Smf involved in DNA uptake
MLGDRESARAAFGAIEQLSPDRREKTDIINACIKYCVYLKDIPTALLTSEEQNFMRTMAEIDTWYDMEINKAKLEGEERQKQAIVLNMRRKNVSLETISEFTGLTIGEIERLLALPNE